MADEPREPAIEVDAIRWERVQLIVEARAPAGVTLDLSRLDLVPDAAGGEAMPPTRATIDGDRLTARFNVLVGPGPGAAGRRPLDAPDRGRPGPSLPTVRPEPGSFTLTNGSYRMTPAVDATARTLTIDVAFDAADRVRKPVRRVTRIRRAAFRTLVSASRLVTRRNKPRVLFTSRLISEMSGNLQVVHDADGRARPRSRVRPASRCSSRASPSAAASATGCGCPWLLATRRRDPRRRLHAGRSTASASPAVRIIQLWHASGAFKTVGYSRVGKPAGPTRSRGSTRTTPHAIVSSDHDVPFYAEAFGIPEARVVPTGIPRMDRFFDERRRRPTGWRPHGRPSRRSTDG